MSPAHVPNRQECNTPLKGTRDLSTFIDKDAVTTSCCVTRVIRRIMTCRALHVCGWRCILVLMQL